MPSNRGVQRLQRWNIVTRGEKKWQWQEQLQVAGAVAGAVVDYDWKNWMTQRVPGNEGTQSLLRIDNRLIRERLC